MAADGFSESVKKPPAILHHVGVFFDVIAVAEPPW
jgi:hypothetical protein